MQEIRERLRTAQSVNVGKTERLASVLGGAGLALVGARRKGVGGALLGLAGAALIARGATGHSFVYQALELDTSEGKQTRGQVELDDGEGVSVNASITVHRPPADAYAFWRDFTHAPRYMDRIAAVEVLDDVRTRWTATGPLGRSWTWESEVVEDRPGELIAWESLPGAELPNRGWVQFLPAGSDRGETEVRYFVEIDPPGGVIGHAIASAFHAAPREMVRDDLRRFRQILEAGEVAATSGQPGGAEEWTDDER